MTDRIYIEFAGIILSDVKDTDGNAITNGATIDCQLSSNFGVSKSLDAWC